MRKKGINGICLMGTLAMLTGCAAKTTEPETSDNAGICPGRIYVGG